MDFLNKLLKVADHDRWKVIGLLLGILAAVAIVGCQPTTGSVLNPGEKVARAELASEAATLKAQAEANVAKIEAGFADLDKQAEFRADVINTLGGLATAAAEGTISPTAGIASIVNLALLGLAGGGIIDGRRKDKLISSG